jgi:hypothetical protein
MTLQLEPPYRFGVRRAKNKEYEQIDDLAVEWEIHYTRVNPDLFDPPNVIHGISCIKFGCHCTPIKQSFYLDEQRELQDKIDRNVRIFTKKDDRCREEKDQFDGYFWENF